MFSSGAGRTRTQSLMVPNQSSSSLGLVEPAERFIRIHALEEYILGKNSVDLEIEYGIPRYLGGSTSSSPLSLQSTKCNAPGLISAGRCRNSGRPTLTRTG